MIFMSLCTLMRANLNIQKPPLVLPVWTSSYVRRLSILANMNISCSHQSRRRKPPPPDPHHPPGDQPHWGSYKNRSVHHIQSSLLESLSCWSVIYLSLFGEVYQGSNLWVNSQLVSSPGISLNGTVLLQGVLLVGFDFRAHNA